MTILANHMMDSSGYVKSREKSRLFTRIFTRKMKSRNPATDKKNDMNIFCDEVFQRDCILVKDLLNMKLYIKQN